MSFKVKGKIMIEESKWDRVLSAVNADKDLDKDNVIEKIYNELKKIPEYKKWEKDGFSVGYLFFDCSQQAILRHAVENNYKNLANVLIEKGVDINVKDIFGWTPLHFAAQGGYKELANVLIKKGADVNVKDIFGQTPLLIAIIIKV